MELELHLLKYFSFEFRRLAKNMFLDKKNQNQGTKDFDVYLIVLFCRNYKT